MPKKQTETTLDDVLEAVNNGFTAMQNQLNRVEVTEAKHHLENQQHHEENQRDHAEMIDRIESVEKQLVQTIKVTDAHDRLIGKFAR